jgi:hypothetical protein
MEFSTLQDPKGCRVRCAIITYLGRVRPGARRGSRSRRVACWRVGRAARAAGPAGAGARSPRPARHAVPAGDPARDRRVRDERGRVQLADLGRGVGTTLRPAGQRRAAANDPPPPPRRNAIAVDGKCLRAARRPDGSQVFVLSAVRHADAVTLASREIRREDQRNQPVRAPAGPDRRRRPHRYGHHRRRVARTTRPRHLPRRAAPRPLPDHCQGQPAHPRRPATTPALETGTRSCTGRPPAGTAATRSAKSRSSPSTTCCSPTPAKSCGSAVNADAWARRNGPARSSTRSPTCPPTRPAPPRSPPGPADTRTIENSVHWIRDVTFDEDANQTPGPRQSRDGVRLG